MSKKNSNAEIILQAAIELAEQSSWEKIHMHQVADKLNISLQDVHRLYQQKDDLVETWYNLADDAMLQRSASAEFNAMNVRQRLHVLIMAWLDFLAAHKKVSTAMLLYKLEPGHIHLQIQGLLRISRTVQWMREAAFLNNTHLQRIIEEIGLSGIFISTFIYWMRDHSEDSTKTRKFLDNKLGRAENLAHTFFRPVSSQTSEDSTPATN